MTRRPAAPKRTGGNGPSVGVRYYTGHDLSRGQLIASTGEPRRASVPRSLWYEIACGLAALAGLLAWGAVAGVWG